MCRPTTSSISGPRLCEKWEHSSIKITHPSLHSTCVTQIGKDSKNNVKLQRFIMIWWIWIESCDWSAVHISCSFLVLIQWAFHFHTVSGLDAFNRGSTCRWIIFGNNSISAISRLSPFIPPAYEIWNHIQAQYRLFFQDLFGNWKSEYPNINIELYCFSSVRQRTLLVAHSTNLQHVFGISLFFFMMPWGLSDVS